MRPPHSKTLRICMMLGLLFAVSSDGIRSQDGLQRSDRGHRWVALPPGVHPSLLFSKQELSKLRERTKQAGTPGEAWQLVTALASGDSSVRYEGNWEAHRLIALALVYQIGGKQDDGRKAIEYFQELLAVNEPVAFYRKTAGNFFDTEYWPRAFAYAWDWLYEAMNDQQRRELLPKLEAWCKALYEHTESWWWRDASYNCGAIPVGALGLLCTAIQGEAAHPEFRKWFSSAVQRIRDNYFPTAWRSNGICYEGPCYAQYHKNPTQFGEALRRTGGEDILIQSGAINAMHYQVFQWMPHGGCGPVGDNTEYGRRVFSASYLLGVEEMQDSAGLWTFEKYADRKSLDPILTFLWYPEGLAPLSPGQAGWPTSCYFEITPRRAGYVYSRSEWDNEHAHYFVFTTRYAEANHQHYDMNSFLFHAFGEEFGTHRNIYGYTDRDHGVDKEHNIVIVDGGGWPANDRPDSAGDDCSTNGLLVGLGLGHLADYVRGDAKDSYRDTSIPGSCPALRADRTCLFVKQGSTPYLLVVDDIQQSEQNHNYDWQWFTLAKEFKGAGSLQSPALIERRNADCAIAFLEPSCPDLTQQIVVGGSVRHKLEMGLFRVRQTGRRVRYVALASAWEKGAARPTVYRGPGITGNPGAVSLRVDGPGFSDLLVWQPEDARDRPAPAVTCGDLSLQGYLALVRRDPNGKITGYVLGEGGRLTVAGKELVRAEGAVSVSADAQEVRVSGRLGTRQGDGPVPASALVRLLSSETQFFVDDLRVVARFKDGLAIAGSAFNK
jgi:hypothetical protein